MSVNFKTFCGYVFPAIGSSMITALYFVVDGMFIGRGIGEMALAASNLALPVIVLIISVTMMLTMGGATLTSISLGEKDPASANRYFGITLILISIFSVIAAFFCSVFPETVAQLSGASRLLLPDCATYIRWYCLFLVFYCMAMCLSVFVRNDGSPKLTMWAMTAGALTNIFLDWLFIFPFQWGLVGAAVASGIGQMLSCVLLLIHFFRKKGQLKLHWPIKDRLAWKQTFQVARRGMPEFCNQMAGTITPLCYNIISLKYLAELGVASYAIMCYLSEIFIAVFLGVSQGIQPLISYNYGAGDTEKQHYFFSRGLICNIILSALIYGLLLIFGKEAAGIFNDDPELVEAAYKCASVYGISFVFAAVNIVFTTWFLSTKKTGAAIIIAVSRGFVFNSAFIFLLPAALGEAFLYAGITAAEVIVAAGCLAYTLITKGKKREQLTRPGE